MSIQLHVRDFPSRQKSCPGLCMSRMVNKQCGDILHYFTNRVVGNIHIFITISLQTIMIISNSLILYFSRLKNTITSMSSFTLGKVLSNVEIYW